MSSHICSTLCVHYYACTANVLLCKRNLTLLMVLSSSVHQNSDNVLTRSLNGIFAIIAVECMAVICCFG